MRASPTAPAFLLLSLVLLPFAGAHAAVLRGTVVNARTNEPLANVNVVLQGARLGAASDSAGRYEIKGITPGEYNVQASSLGYRKVVLYEIAVSNARPAALDITLDEEPIVADSVLVTASPFRKTDESPLSSRTLGAAEIDRFPGGNRDISKAVQSLPGVGSTPNFRNDLIIRGGAPNENRFYIDGIEVPNINHFATQGSSGGPVGMINVNFVREVNLLTGAFPAGRGNALSSIMDFQMKDGNNGKLATTATVGISDFGLTLDGPLGDRSTFILSARRSYLQLVLKALGLPFLPAYNDLQFKTRTRLDERNEITFLGLGAIDNFTLNDSASDTEINRYILEQVPVNSQWNYALGGTWKHFNENGLVQLVVSRNQLHNDAIKYFRNQDSDPSKLVLDYESQEIENKVRLERATRRGAWRYSYGLGVESATYTNHTYEKRAIQSGLAVVNFDSRLTFGKFSGFAQASRSSRDERLTVSVGARTDFTDYSSAMGRPLDQLSPRLSASYALTDRLSLNFNTGRYYQLPAATVLGFRDSLGALVNKGNGVKYIRCDHLVGGLELSSSTNSRVSLEGFYKRYADYPFLLQDSVSLANLGADFGVIGNAPVVPTSRGRSYGLELLAQQKLYNGFYGNLSYTFVRSEFTARQGEFQPSAWDNRHIFSMTGGKELGRGWEIGGRWRYLGGAPYTPDNVELSSRVEVWDARARGVPDYALLNTRRNGPLHQLDLRVDKKWFLRGSSINLYADVQNVYNHRTEVLPVLALDRDPGTGAPLLDPANPGRYLTHIIKDDDVAFFPTLGLIFEF